MNKLDTKTVAEMRDQFPELDDWSDQEIFDRLKNSWYFQRLRVTVAIENLINAIRKVFDNSRN